MSDAPEILSPERFEAAIQHVKAWHTACDLSALRDLRGHDAALRARIAALEDELHPVREGRAAWQAEGTGTDRLCRALHGREARPADYLGGADASMLHHAADRIAALEARAEADREAMVSWRDDMAAVALILHNDGRFPATSIEVDKMVTEIRARLAAHAETHGETPRTHETHGETT